MFQISSEVIDLRKIIKDASETDRACFSRPLPPRIYADPRLNMPKSMQIQGRRGSSLCAKAERSSAVFSDEPWVLGVET